MVNIASVMMKPRHADDEGRAHYGCRRPGYGMAILNWSACSPCAAERGHAEIAAAMMVVNIASVAGMVMMKGRAHYAVSKAGVATLTRSLANEWAEDGIRVIAVAPGYVKTPMIQRSIEAGELDERKLAAMHPLNRLATTQEIAAAMIALARRRSCS